MIGFFDSGLGGLTVLKAVKAKLPQYNYIYLGDNARAPYGNKSQDLIFDYTKEALEFLFEQDCSLVIIACNTASAEALRKIQREWLSVNYPDKKVLGVLVPAVEELVEYFQDKKTLDKKVGIIATEATTESGKYEREIKKLDNQIEIFSCATPLLVPLVEGGWEKNKETKKILEEYLNPLKEKEIKALILGCTHYPFLQEKIEEVIGQDIKIINTPVAVANKLEIYLKKHSALEQRLKKDRKLYFYTTDDEENFRKLGEKFLGEKINDLKKVSL
jgi:glutamate racemase